MHPRPPASNAELAAWNFGADLAASRLGTGDRKIKPGATIGSQMTGEEVAAYLRLGDDTFLAWVVQGARERMDAAETETAVSS